MHTKARRIRRSFVAALTVVGLTVGGVVATTAPATAADVTATQQLVKKTVDADGYIRPGETFDYSLEFTCSSSQAVTGCGNSTITDLLPEWIRYVSVSAFPGAATGTTTVTEEGGRDKVVITFTNPVTVPASTTGLPLGSYLMTIKVKLADDAPWEIDGTTITNTAQLTADNADAAQSSSPIIPLVDPKPAATAGKTYDPAQNFNTPGLGTTLTLTGKNTTNGGVDTLTVQDPAGSTIPTDATSPFHHLAFTDFGATTLPTGADRVEASVYTATDGWVPVYSGAGPPTYPATGAPDKDDVLGVRYVFSNSSGSTIPRDATATTSIALTQRAGVRGLSAATTVSNTVSATVSLDATTASGEETAEYRIVPYGLQVAATKTFDKDEIKAGQSSTVRLTATNSGTAPLSSLTIREPGTTTPGALAGDLTFDGFAAGVQWPAGATKATIVYHYDDGGSSDPLSTTSSNTLPAVPAGADRVVGFDVEFTSAAGIPTGAEARVPFTVTTERGTTPPDHVQVPNDVDVVGAALDDPTRTANATASDVLHIYGDRIAVSVAKRVGPSEIWLTPGQRVVASLPAKVEEFPATTVNPTEIVVSDTGVLSADWWDVYDATELTQLGMVANAALTVQYTTGSGWSDLPGAVGLTGDPTYRTVSIDPALSSTITGLRFVYTAIGDASFAPGTTVQPNITFTTRATTRDDATPIRNLSTTTPIERENCAAATAHQEPLDLDAAAVTTDPCPVVTLKPVTGTGPDLVDKTFDKPSVTERTQDGVTAFLRWSTGGLTGIAQQYVTETGSTSYAPATTGTYETSFFDSFDLVALGRISTTSDPLMRFDRIAAIELYDSVAETWKPVTVDGKTSWDGATGSGTSIFPGYTLTADERKVVTGVRYLIEESPNRADVITAGSLTDPAVGSGVAASTDRRPIALDFQLRDALRSDATVPVLAGDVYNLVAAGEVRNTVTSVACKTAFTAGVCADPYTSRDGATMLILDGTANIDLVKVWDGGPVGIPASTTAQEDYPSTRATLKASNRGPQKVDRITLSDPAPNMAFDGSAFDAFTLVDIVSITEPAGADTSKTRITLTYDGGAPSNSYTVAEAKALTAADLKDVVGITATADGRISAKSGENTLSVVVDLQLRKTFRHDGSAISAVRVPNTLSGSIADPSVEAAGSCAGSDPAVAAPANTVIACTTAHVDIQQLQERTVTAGKSFSATTISGEPGQYEDDDATFAMSISGQPAGNARSNQVVLTDDSPAFWNAYRFAGLASGFTIASPANRVKIEVLAGATYTAGAPDAATQLSTLTAAGGTWQTVERDGDQWLSAKDAKAALPANAAANATIAVTDGTVRYDEVQGVRITYQRVASGSIGDPAAALMLFENPASPKLIADMRIQRRTELLTGGDVPTTLAGNIPAPGTPSAGEYPNTVTAVASGVDGAPVQDDADDTMWFRHLPTAVETKKTPTGSKQPATDFTVTLATKNTGRYPIIDPVITDTLPTGAVTAGLPDYVFPEGVDPSDPRNYTFAITGGTAPTGYTAMPVDPSKVTVSVVRSSGTDPEPVKLTFTFAEDVALGLGQTYTISWDMRLRPGVRAAQVLTNTYDVTGERVFDECNTVKTPVTACAASAAITVDPLPNFTVVQSVKADDAELGVISAKDGVTCTTADADADGFYTAPCAPVTKPGELDTWRMQYQNVGTYAFDTMSSVVYLPQSGRSGIDLPSETSEWTPTLAALPVLASDAVPGAVVTTYYTTEDTTGTDLCDAVLNENGSCPAGYWQPVVGTTVPTGATGLFIVVDFLAAGDPLQPGEGFELTFKTKAPGYADAAETSPVSWNSVKTGATYTDGSRTEVKLPVEVPVVGVTLATGAISLVKSVTGAAKDESWVPSAFDGTLSCTSAGAPVPASSLPTVPTLVAGTPVTLTGLPWGATCEFVETDAGSVVTLSPSTVTALADPTVTGRQGVTNNYEYASLRIEKTVTASTGFTVPTGFAFSVECTYLGATVLRDTFTLDHGGHKEYDGLPARSACVVEETDARGADDTVITADIVSPTATPVVNAAARTITIPELSPDKADAVQNTVRYDNRYDVVGLTITKELEGAGAAQFGEEKTFTVGVVCHFGTGTGRQKLVDTTVTLSASNLWTAQVAGTGGSTGLIAGSDCAITEPNLQGADAVVITYDGDDITGGTMTLPQTGTAEVTVTNWYLTGSVEVTKAFTGDGVAEYGDPVDGFTVTLECVRDGEEVRIPGGAVRTVSQGAPTALYEALPTGSDCTLTETDTGAAGETAILDASGAVLAADATAGHTFTVTTDPTLLAATDQAQPALTVQNTFNLAEVTVAKTVATDAVDGNGDPVPFGPFKVTLECTFRGASVTAAEPMTQTIADGGSFTWTELPEGADCTVSETDDADASSTTMTVTEGGATGAPVTDTTVTLAPLPAVAASDQTSVAIENVYDVVSLAISKEVDGSGAAEVSRTFPVHVVCELLDASHPDGFTVRDETFELGGPAGRTALLEHLPVGTSCTVTETDAGGASATAIGVRVVGSPDGEDVTRGETVTVTLLDPETTMRITNTFIKPLPPTGVALTWAIPMSGLLLMLAGAFLVIWRRRRA